MSPAKGFADRNLPFGVMAWREGLVSGKDMLDALHAWSESPDHFLGEVLRKNGKLTLEQQSMVETKLEQHLSSLPSPPTSLPVADTSAPRPSRYVEDHLHRPGGLGEVWLAQDKSGERWSQSARRSLKGCPVMSSCVKAAVAALAVVSVAGLWDVRAAAPPSASVVEVKLTPAKGEKRARTTDTRVRDARAKKVDFRGFDDEKIALTKALDELAKSHKVTFNLNALAFERDGLPDVQKVEFANSNLVRLTKVPLATVLRTILNRVVPRSRATFLIRKDHIEITTEAAVRRELGLPVPKLARDAKNALDRTPLVWEEFRGDRLDDIFCRLAETMDTTILIDPRCKEKAGKKIDATLRNLPLDDAVELLAEMGGLAAVKRQNAYFITTRENAERMRKAER